CDMALIRLFLVRVEAAPQDRPHSQHLEKSYGNGNNENTRRLPDARKVRSLAVRVEAEAEGSDGIEGTAFLLPGLEVRRDHHPVAIQMQGREADELLRPVVGQRAQQGRI